MSETKPKEMTNEELVRKFVLGPTTSDIPPDSLCAEWINWTKSIETELLRRLNEADALRKENEELRKDKKRLDCLESICPNGNVGDIRCFGTWRMTIDDAAHLAKESEASHE